MMTTFLTVYKILSLHLCEDVTVGTKSNVTIFYNSTILVNKLIAIKMTCFLPFNYIELSQSDTQLNREHNKEH